MSTHELSQAVKRDRFDELQAFTLYFAIQKLQEKGGNLIISCLPKSDWSASIRSGQDYRSTSGWPTAARAVSELMAILEEK